MYELINQDLIDFNGLHVIECKKRYGRTVNVMEVNLMTLRVSAGNENGWH